ncbi:hypothetical protein PG994_002421 [Apiospora phragmitis]|uniref:ATP-grasp domain-containing protein n=1 Tax=Apiospora phragmitis TaxID=2905665 RepID=A0ABR1WWD0_9PEZI
MAEYPLSDTIRTFSLIALNILLLPLSLLTLCLGHVAQYVFPQSTSSPVHHREEDARDRRTILVTGVGMAKGLALARAFHLSGHRVIGADFESPGIPCPGRSSRSLSAFYRLPKPTPSPNKSKAGGAADAYVERLVDIVQTDGIDLWVSCSGVASAAEDAVAKEALERRTRCRCVQFDRATTMRLHEKDCFMRKTARLGLPCPETHTVTSQREILGILYASSSSSSSSSASPAPETNDDEKQQKKNQKKKQFILKPIGVDDANRGNMTLLPLPTRRETEAYLARLPEISTTNSWIAQQFVPGGEEYCTHALVVRGQVRCFAACPSAELLMHYRPLPADSALARAMLRFTREFVARSEGGATMTGHLSFDFMVEDDGVTEQGFQRNMYAIECNPRAHTAVVLFAQPGPEMRDMVRAYLSAIEPKSKINGSSTAARTNGDGEEADEMDLVTPPSGAQSRYWIGHDLLSLVVHPAYRLATGRISLREFIGGIITFCAHVLTWKEGTWVSWEPMACDHALPCILAAEHHRCLVAGAAMDQGQRQHHQDVQLLDVEYMRPWTKPMMSAKEYTVYLIGWLLGA